MHPFSEAYYAQELASMAAVRPTCFGSVSVSRESAARPPEAYLHQDPSTCPLENIPILRIDGQVWMSLTPMEVQSSFMPIQLAHGRVGTAGLGLGYFVQRVVNKPEVEKVIVYELRSEIIECYLRTFGPHPKLELRHANARLLHGERWDMFYADVYRSLLTPQAIADFATLSSENTIGTYHWWSIEQFVLEVIHAGLAHRLPRSMLRTYIPFLELFIRHPCAASVSVFGCGHALVDDLEHYGLSLEPRGERVQVPRQREARIMA